jgi:hypothetical protein
MADLKEVGKEADGWLVQIALLDRLLTSEKFAMMAFDPLVKKSQALSEEEVNTIIRDNQGIESRINAALAVYGGDLPWLMENITTILANCVGMQRIAFLTHIARKLRDTASNPHLMALGIIPGSTEEETYPQGFFDVLHMTAVPARRRPRQTNHLQERRTHIGKKKRGVMLRWMNMTSLFILSTYRDMNIIIFVFFPFLFLHLI